MKALPSSNRTHAVINQNFLIRVNEQGNSFLTTARKLSQVVGEDQAVKMFDKAMSSGLDTYRRKLRRGVCVTFVGR